MRSGQRLSDLDTADMYEVALAMYAERARDGGAGLLLMDEVFDDVSPMVVVAPEQTRRADGMLEHNPDMEIPGWGYADPTAGLSQGPASTMTTPPVA